MGALLKLAKKVETSVLSSHQSLFVSISEGIELHRMKWNARKEKKRETHLDIL
jgi:hypothetical protein